MKGDESGLESFRKLSWVNWECLDTPDPTPLLTTQQRENPLPMLEISADHDSNLSGLNKRAQEVIYEGILQPLLAKEYLKDFHGFLTECTSKVQTKEIICLRDLEILLLFKAVVSIFFSNASGTLADKSLLKDDNYPCEPTAQFLAFGYLVYQRHGAILERTRTNSPIR
jgi:hypothetical protein